MKKVEDYIRTIPDFPEPGIMFRDVTSILQSAEGLKLAIDEMIRLLDGVEFDVIAGAESRGFIFGVPIAYAMGKPFVPVRKAGKLPCETVSKSYDLEYGQATIEIHKDAITDKDVVLLHDDLLATGGSMKAAYNLVQKFCPRKTYINFIIELTGEGLNGRAVFDDSVEMTTLIKI